MEGGIDAGQVLTVLASVVGSGGMLAYFMKRSNERLSLLEKKESENAVKVQHLMTWEKAQNGALQRIEKAVQKILGKLEK